MHRTGFPISVRHGKKAGREGCLRSLPLEISLIQDGSEFTPPFKFTGQPAMIVPLHWHKDGLPIGLQFVGRYADETARFRLTG